MTSNGTARRELSSARAKEATIWPRKFEDSIPQNGGTPEIQLREEVSNSHDAPAATSKQKISLNG
jgi:hypothetical protein